MFTAKKSGIFLVIGMYLLGIMQAHAAPTYLRVFSPSVQALAQAKAIKPLANTTPITFTVWLKLRNKAQLDQLVPAMYDPRSPHYQQFLAPGIFDKYYAPSPEAEQAVLHYFLAQGMQAKMVNHSISVTASAQQVERTLKTRLHYYSYQGQTVYANSTAPVLSADIAPYILEISGLDNLHRFRPAALRRRDALASVVAPRPLYFAWDTFKPQAQPSTQSVNGFTGADLRAAYNVAAVAPIQGTNINGAGQTLVIIDACGTYGPAQIMADANKYSAVSQLPTLNSKNFAVLNPNGTPVKCVAHDSSWDDEISLDIQASHTIAENANIVLVLAPTDNDLDATAAEVIYTLITNNYRIGGFAHTYVMSNSWSGTEPGAYDPALETSIEIAAAHGISFNVSTGDCGDNTYSNSGCEASSQPAVNYPGSSAFSTAVGGTSLFVDNNWHYAFESLWGSYFNGQFNGGSGGGISQNVDAVSWQNSISHFTAGGYTAGTIGAYNKRAVPDIAMLADPQTGLLIYVNGGIIQYGGTSLACPLFSGTLLLVNQARSLLNGGAPHPLGQAAPYLYHFNSTLLYGAALNLVAPPHLIISGAMLPPAGAPLSAFTLEFFGTAYTFGWDSSVTIAPENQFWNDGVGVGTPYIPNFVAVMATL